MSQNILNPQQQQIVDTTEGPLLVIAGPGSGKTKTLVERVVHLLELGVEPQSIMISTFTEKAAKELLTRISNRLIENKSKVNPNELHIGTLHSIFLKLIEEHQEYSVIKRNYRLLDPFDQAFLIYSNLSQFNAIADSDLIINPKGNKYVDSWSTANIIVKKINVISEEALCIDTLLKSGDPEINTIAQFYQIYRQILETENALDFSSIQSELLRMLENQIVLDSIQNSIKYFMIDEYQDTNTIQEKILLKLASKNNNICVVGDDDQGLYRFRGATIRNILQFENNFANGDCKKVYLTTNYRSHPGIIKFYNDFMKSKNWGNGTVKYRFEKDIVPCDNKFHKTASVIKVSASSEDDYHKNILDFITTLKTCGAITDYNQITFLFRSVKGDEAISLINYLEDNGIRVFSPRSGQFFDRKEVQFVIGALLSMFPQVLDEESGIVTSNRFLPVLQAIEDYFSRQISTDQQTSKDLIAHIVHYQRKHANLTKNTDYSFSKLVYELFAFKQFSKYLDTELTAETNDLRPAYNIGILLKLISKFEYLYNVSVLTPKSLNHILRQFFNFYLRFIFDGGLEEYEDFDQTIPSGCVSFMTIHQAKGLEFPITVVGSMSGVPRKSYDSLDEMLQNRYFSRVPFEPIQDVKYFDFYRLYYTAFSRAKNLLVLCGKQRNGAGACPSKYLADIWNSTPDWQNTKIFKPDRITQSDVTPVNIKHEYAFTSHILLYEACPLQYKFYKEFEFTEIRQGGMIGGTLLHQTIEDIHKAVLKGEEYTLTDSNIENWFNSNYAQLVKSQHGYIHEAQRKAILRQVLRYRDSNNGKWNQIKEAEVDVSLVKEDYILKGKIDLIKGSDGTVELVDFKSGDKPDVNTTDAIQKTVLNQYRRQLEVYAYIIEQKTGNKISRLNLYYPKEENGNPKITFEYKPDMVQNTINSFEEVVHKIEQHDFSMKGHACSEKHCGECDLRFYCHK